MARTTVANRENEANDFNRLDDYLLNAVADAPDFRDFTYQPALLQLAEEVPPPAQGLILDQGKEGTCTGFGLAAVINLLLARRGQHGRPVSPRMLYEMARKYDEWQGEDYSGSSCRGAIQGWHNMGVCSEKLAPYTDSEKCWSLSIEQAKEARATTLGAYYRVRKRLSDYHAAINETGVLFASARVHSGWKRDSVKNGLIEYRSDPVGSHAFAIVGYNRQGFWVQNSWGKKWGNKGLALWSYQDWLENVRDAWAVRMAISTPQIWHLAVPPSSDDDLQKGLFSRSPKRAEIVGHYVHIDDGEFDTRGRYWSDLASVRQTADLVARSEKYKHLLFYAHGGLNSTKASARRIAAMKEVFKDNGIYPFHFMYDTGLLEEIKDLVLGKKKQVEARAGGLTDYTDKLLEGATRPAGRAVWREMKNGARKPFEKNENDEDGAGIQTIAAFLSAFTQPAASSKQFHVVGHSTGAILLASFLRALGDQNAPPRIQSCQLMAPACTHKLFSEVYRPLMKEESSAKYGIERMTVYNLDTKLELDDTVTPLYRKSLLYLVSNAFEDKHEELILGMQKFRSRLGSLPSKRIFKIYCSDGTKSRSTKTSSTTHGGFDNDLATMNNVLKTVLDTEPIRKFTSKDLRY